MKQMKKILAIVMCLGIFAAIAMGSGDSKDGDTKEIGGASSDEKEKVTIEEAVVLDQNDIKITAKEYVEDSIWGDGISMQIENNSGKDVMVSCKALIVNNYMITDLFASEVAAGKKANEVMRLSSSALEAAGIESVGQIEIYFRVYDPSSYDTIFEAEPVTIKTSAFDNMDTTPNDLGTELYNKDGIKIVGKAVDEDSFWGAGILLYCENTSGKNVGISVEDLSVNGFMMTPVFSTTVYNNKMVIDDITLFSSDLEENGITSIDEVELKFHIYDADSYSTIADSDTIKFNTK